MKNNYIYLIAGLLLFGMVSCTSEDDLVEDRIEATTPAPAESPTFSAGTADFSTYVSLGNSLTAGLMDAALYTSGQESSFPNILAASFAQAGGGTFNQPDVGTENGFNTSANNLEDIFVGGAFGKFILDTSIPGPIPTTPGDPLTFVTDPSSINNLGVPGMRLIELTVNGYGQLNPFYTRFALDPTSTSVLEQAIAKQPTFMTMWLGNNDVLLWASGGGVGADGNEDPTADLLPSSLVSDASFNATIDGAIAALLGNFPNMKIVMLNIPNVTVTPFFQAVAYNAIEIDGVTAAAATAGFDDYNAILDALGNPALGSLALSAEEIALRKISFSVGANPPVVVDDQLTDITAAVAALQALGAVTAEEAALLGPFAQARQLKSATEDPALAAFGLGGELLTLSSGSVLGTLAVDTIPESVIGLGVPLDDSFTLTTDEITRLLTRITTFNTKLATVAATNDNIALVDINTVITNAAINGGVVVDGLTLAPDFGPNGIYSTDGIHPNPRGYAIIANEVMSVIETEFGATLPRADVLSFRSVIFQ